MGLMTRNVVEVIVMAAIFTIIAACFSIPIVIYATDSRDITPNKDAVNQLDINDCSLQV